MIRRFAVAAGTALIVAGWGGIVPAHASFPTNNGGISFTSYRCNGSANIFVVDPVSKSVYQVSNVGDDNNSFVSSDGNSVVFSSTRTGNHHILTVPFANQNLGCLNAQSSNADTATDITRVGLGDNPHCITPPVTDPACTPDDFNPSWTRSGFVPAWASSPSQQTSVVFQRSVSSGPDQIFGMDDSGHHQVNLTNSTHHETQPVINPTNPNLIAFVSDRTGTHQIFTVDLTNPALPVYTNLSNNAFDDIKPDWSSDGTKIVFSSSRSGHSQIWEMSSAGTGQTSLKINDNGLTEIDPAWSPDNSMITFSERGPSAPPSQDIMDTFEVPATSAQTAATPVDLTQSSPARDIEPNWQPISSTAVVPESPMALLLPASGALLLVGGTLAGRGRRRCPAPMAV